MARTIPATWSTEAAKTFGKPLLLHKLNIDTPIYIGSGKDGLSFDGNTYSAHLMRMDGSIGSEVDWRGGLAAEETHKVHIIQGRETLTGTSWETLERFEDSWALLRFDNSPPTAVHTFPNSESPSDSVVYLVWDDGSPTVAESITVLTGQVHDAIIRDYGPAVYEIGTTRDAFLSRKFINLLGQEGTGDENYDTTRNLSSAGQNEPIPIMYGTVAVAQGVFVHDEATLDHTDHSGLLICYSDVRWVCKEDGTGVTLGVWSDDREEMLTVIEESSDWRSMVTSPVGNQTQWEYVGSATIPEGVGYTDGGAFVRFLSELDTRAGDLNDGPLNCSAGILLVEFTYPFDKERNFTGKSAPYGAGTGATDGDDSTKVTITGNNTSYYNWRMPSMSGWESLHSLFIQWKIQKDTAGDNFKAIYFFDNPESSGETTSNLHVEGDQEKPATSAEWSHTGTGVYNNWTGADDPLEIRFTSAHEGVYSPSRIGNGHAEVFVDTSATRNADYYGGQLVIWGNVSWADRANKVYALNVDGIKDDGTGTYTGTASALVEVPSDVMYHFVDQVVGETSRIDTASVASARTDMAADGLKFAMQLVDPAETAENILDKMALQSMSWIVPTDTATEKIIYRPTLAISTTDAENPITEADILKGSMQSAFTPREDVYSGFTLNYNWNPASRKYDSVYKLYNSTHAIVTNVPTAGDYAAILDKVATQTTQELTVNADYVQDDTHAEKLIKWLMLQHCRRRQILTFDLPLAFASIEVGDVIAIDHPMTRVYEYGEALQITVGTSPTTIDTTKKVGSSGWPKFSGAFMLVEHVDDILFIESGANAGSWRITGDDNGWINNNLGFAVDSGHSMTTDATGAPWRVVPSYVVLSSPIVFDDNRGLIVRVKCIEKPVFRAGQADFD